MRLWQRKCGMTFSMLSSFLLLFPVLAWSFGIGDHEKMTRQAFREFMVCFPESITRNDLELLVDGNLGEDLNLFRKWSEFSHFFNPEKKLEMRRRGSLDRVAILEAELTRPLRGELFVGLGQLIHHLQDSASPPHVVPVNHWLTDGFERFEVADLLARTPDEAQCPAFGTGETPVRILYESAQKTLASVRAGLLGFRNGKPLLIPWAFFWEESSDSSFGHYGVFGNQFGTTSFFAQQSHYEVSDESYREFKRVQLRQGIQATKEALSWALLKPACQNCF